MTEIKKVYLGDAVYADFDGYHIILTTENGIRADNRICLEPDVMQALQIYAETIRKALEQEKPIL